jgi:hypothetical protein
MSNMTKANENIYYQNPKKIIELFKSGSVVEIYNQFDTTMLKELSPRRLEPIWFQMQRNYGEFVNSAVNDTLLKSNSIIINTDLIFKKGIMNMMLSWDRNSNKIDGFFLTEVKKESLLKMNIGLPSYIDTTKFTREKIVIEANYPIEGELTTPKSNVKSSDMTFILVSGKGRLSKDVKIGPNKVFKNLAWGLSSFGHSVIRFDKISYKHTRKLLKDNPDYTFKDEYIKPTISTITKAKSITNIANNKLILIGYEEGVKAVAELVSIEDVDGLVLLMGSPFNQYDLELDKLKFIFGYDNLISPAEKSMINATETKINYYKTLKDSSDINNDSLPLGKSYIYLKSIDYLKPIESLENTIKPVLIINSSNDFEIREKHFQEWNELSSNENINIVIVEKLDHLMRNSADRSHPKLYRKEAPISPLIFDEINQWIKQNE